MSRKEDLSELQLQHQQQMREKREAVRRRKARTHRLIIRGAIAENAIDGAASMTDEQFQEALFQAMGKSCASATGHPQEPRWSAPREGAAEAPCGSTSRERPSEDPAEQPSAERTTSHT